MYMYAALYDIIVNVLYMYTVDDFPYLRARIVQYLDMSIERMLHCVSGTVFTMGQIPKQFQHLGKVECGGYMYR